MVYNLLRLLIVVALGFLFGKLASKLKMPAVLGFLIAGMALGPNAANLLTQEILDAPAYERLISVLECGMGLMLGTEMVWKRMRRYGKQVWEDRFGKTGRRKQEPPAMQICSYT